MEGEEVVIFLKTPLYRFKYKMGDDEHQLIENAVHLEGTVVAERDQGVVVKVHELSSQKQQQDELPFERLFIPFDKVDFMILLEE